MMLEKLLTEFSADSAVVVPCVSDLDFTRNEQCFFGLFLWAWAKMISCKMEKIE